MTQVIQGTWEEILLHAEQLRGQSGLVLTVPGKNEAGHSGDLPPLSETLAALLKEGEQISPNPSPPPTDPSDQVFGEIMAEKYRRMGFKL